MGTEGRRKEVSILVCSVNFLGLGMLTLWVNGSSSNKVVSHALDVGYTNGKIPQELF